MVATIHEHDHDLRFASQDSRCSAAEAFSVVDRADAGRNAKFNIRHLPLAAFAANLADGLQHVQHAAGGRWLTAVDHAAAGLNRQIALESEIGFLEERLVVSPAKTQVFDLDHHD